LESLSEQIQLQVAGAYHGAPRRESVEITQEKILGIPRAAIHLVDDFDRVDSEERRYAERAHPLLHGFDGNELAVEFLDCEAGSCELVGHHVGDAGFANSGWTVEQDFYRRAWIVMELACFG
jgi:hypothetical protein